MVDISVKPRIQVRQLFPIKLKDKEGRSRVTLHLEAFFGFVPETLIIEKMRGENNTIRISAVLTAEELENERKRDKKRLEKK